MEAPAPTQGLLEGMNFPIPTKIERISKKQILYTLPETNVAPENSPPQ